MNDIKKILKDCNVRLSSDKTYTLFMELKLRRLDKRRSMTPNELQKFFGDEGIALTGPEIKSLFAAFDADNNNELSSDEFMKFAEQARTAHLNPNSDFWSTLPTLQEYLKLLEVDTAVDKAKLRLSGVRALEKLAHTNLEAEKEQKMLEKGSLQLLPALYWIAQKKEYRHKAEKQKWRCGNHYFDLEVGTWRRKRCNSNILRFGGRR